MAKIKRTKGLIDWLVLNVNFNNILAILWTKGQTTIYQILHSKQDRATWKKNLNIMYMVMFCNTMMTFCLCFID